MKENKLDKLLCIYYDGGGDLEGIEAMKNAIVEENSICSPEDRISLKEASEALELTDDYERFALKEELRD